jgi:predicted tellurium resistance membrane protein TerC
MPIVSDRKAYFPLLFLFLGLSLVFLVLQYFIQGTFVNYRVLLVGNLLLFIVGWISVTMSKAALEHKNVQIFLRLVYGSFLLKFFVLAIGAFVYIALYKKNINKPALLGCFGLYIIYAIIELRSVMKQSKKPNA